MNNLEKYNCPICGVKLNSSGPKYFLSDLLKLWGGVDFSEEVIDQHIEQSAFTQLFSCLSCGFEVFYPQIIGTSDFYLALLKNQDNLYYTNEKWDFTEGLKDLSAGQKIVELGCGPGHFLELAKKQGVNVLGVEYNPLALEVARKKDLAVIGIGENCCDKGTFDIAYSFHVLEHVQSPVEFIEEMFSWVKPGGRVAISVPNMDGPIKYIEPCISNMPPHHASRWRLSAFKALALNKNYHIERVVIEPLFLRDGYYYTEYASKKIITKPLALAKLFQFLFKNIFKLGFSFMKLIGCKSTRLLSGQSIYIVLSKANH
ncbi:class I SAM-dependent methyltransferase [Polynucleobacter sp. 15G-AUS-farblos]|uniref:class I SAM-dependent methyltransferase n=1 Tax=Polynucleobacter sp. 15G-AUS-farblos TaxID=2689094 RepID=UPI001C0C9314|nr:class I SAM-dependent methyltransferase [Polynucleobacter sp. 15G-AUS-farblos]MBU3584088.1 class I SAM-dependent methyltransferase [Polynucleobacter sp. 15G-AUS-farblos]